MGGGGVEGVVERPSWGWVGEDTADVVILEGVPLEPPPREPPPRETPPRETPTETGAKALHTMPNSARKLSRFGAGGLPLHLSSSSQSGYKCVYYKPRRMPECAYEVRATSGTFFGLVNEWDFFGLA